MKFCKKIAVLLAAIVIIMSFAALSASAERQDMGMPLSEYFGEVAIDYQFNSQSDYIALGKRQGALEFTTYAYDSEGKYATTATTKASQHYYDLKVNKKYLNAVFEFDMAFMEMPTAGKMQVQVCVPTPNTPEQFITMFEFSTTTIAGKAATWNVGEWKRFALVLNATSDTCDIYYKDTLESEYTFIQTKNLGHDAQSLFVKARFNCTFGGGLVAYDNMAVYEGSKMRDFRALKDATDADKFAFMAPYLNSAYLPDIQYAYDNMTKLLATFTPEQIEADSALKAAVEKYNDFDYPAIKGEIMAYNQGVFNDKMEALGKLVRKFSNVAERESAVAEVEQFVSTTVFNTDSEEYKNASRALTNRRAELTNDYKIADFITFMKRFELSPNIAGKTKHYESASAIVNGEGGIDVAILSDPELSQYYTEYQTYYEMYRAADGIIQALINTENSRRFVVHMAHLASFEGYLTEPVWQENFEEFNMYITYSRGVIESGEYDENYEGFAEAYAVYEPINEYFYEFLQQSHADVIGGMLERYNEVDSYVVKLGYCREIRNYIENNSVDEAHPAVAELIELLSIYESEVELLRLEYLQTLVSNTAYFIGYVNQMDATRGYTQLKALYGKAAEYYYLLNVDAENVVDAVSRFESYGRYLASVEHDSEQLISYANGIENKVGDELYLALAGCYRYVGNVSTDIAGVSAAIEAYEAALAEYEAETETINGEIEDSGNVICSVYYPPVVKPVMRVIRKMFY